jgi:hypothetical protein
MEGCFSANSVYRFGNRMNNFHWLGASSQHSALGIQLFSEIPNPALFAGRGIHTRTQNVSLRPIMAIWMSHARDGGWPI